MNKWMANVNEKLTVIFEKDGKRTIAKSPVSGKRKIVIIINNQFTNAPNTTQIASGAGRSSAAGNNAAIDSSNTRQQQSVGAGGKAKNRGMKGKQSQPHNMHGKWSDEKEVVLVINNQVVADTSLNEGDTIAAATQVASGGGIFSTGGTNSAIESSNTKQQHGVGGGKGARALNKGMNGKQKEIGFRRRGRSLIKKLNSSSGFKKHRDKKRRKKV
jgi:hypothetical protein